MTPIKIAQIMCFAFPEDAHLEGSDGDTLLFNAVHFYFLEAVNIFHTKSLNVTHCKFLKWDDVTSMYIGLIRAK